MVRLKNLAADAFLTGAVLVDLHDRHTVPTIDDCPVEDVDTPRRLHQVVENPLGRPAIARVRVCVEETRLTQNPLNRQPIGALCSEQHGGSAGPAVFQLGQGAVPKLLGRLPRRLKVLTPDAWVKVDILQRLSGAPRRGSAEVGSDTPKRELDSNLRLGWLADLPAVLREEKHAFSHRSVDASRAHWRSG